MISRVDAGLIVTGVIFNSGTEESGIAEEEPM
jgi:hypothetical protein